LRKKNIAAQSSAMAAAMPIAIPTYAPVVRLLEGEPADAAVIGEGLLVGVVVAAVVLELEGRILV
jgi:hypothetical protein